MKPGDVEALASECIAEDWEDHAPGRYRQMDLNRFAALVLERAAQNNDEAAAEWGRIAKVCTSGMYDHKQCAAQQLADDLRQMAEGLKP